MSKRSARGGFFFVNIYERGLFDFYVLSVAKQTFFLLTLGEKNHNVNCNYKWRRILFRYILKFLMFSCVIKHFSIRYYRKIIDLIITSRCPISVHSPLQLHNIVLHLRHVSLQHLDTHTVPRTTTVFS